MNKSEQLIACLEGEIAKRDARIVELQRYEYAFNEWHDKTEWVQAESATLSAKYLGCHRADVMRSLIDDLRAELAACRIAVENCDLFRARIAELEDDLKCAHSMLCEVSKSGMVLRAELAAIKAQEPVAEVKHGPLDSSGWPEFVRVKTIGDFDLENLPNGMKFYAAPAAPAADAGVNDHDQ